MPLAPIYNFRNSSGSKKGGLDLDIEFSRRQPGALVKIILRNRQLVTLYDFWSDRGHMYLPVLEEDTYLLQISYWDGPSIERVMDLNNRQWNFFTANFNQSPRRDTIYGNRTGPGPFFNLGDDSVSIRGIPQDWDELPFRVVAPAGKSNDINGRTAVFYTQTKTIVIPFETDRRWEAPFHFIIGKKTYSVFLPYRSNGNFHISLGSGPNDPLKIEVSIQDAKLDLLAKLMASNDTNAQPSLKNLVLAENFLQGKFRDVNKAIVGGYYLLKTRSFRRMHNWTNNLATYFPYLPDASIIHAGRLMLRRRKSPEIITIIRELLITASRRIPVYTEGFRILYRGLQQLYYYYKQQDNEVNKAFQRVKAIERFVDWSKVNTTLVNTELNDNPNGL